MTTIDLLPVVLTFALLAGLALLAICAGGAALAWFAFTIHKASRDDSMADALRRDRQSEKLMTLVEKVVVDVVGSSRPDEKMQVAVAKSIARGERPSAMDTLPKPLYADVDDMTGDILGTSATPGD